MVNMTPMENRNVPYILWETHSVTSVLLFEGTPNVHYIGLFDWIRVSTQLF